jgi:hypothetical protein
MTSHAAKGPSGIRVASMNYFSKSVERLREIKPYRPDKQEKLSGFSYALPQMRGYGSHNLRTYQQSQNDFPSYRFRIEAYKPKINYGSFQYEVRMQNYR